MIKDDSKWLIHEAQYTSSASESEDNIAVQYQWH